MSPISGMWAVSNRFQGFHNFWNDKVLNKLRAKLGRPTADLSEDLNRYCNVLQDEMDRIANKARPAGTHLVVKDIDIGSLSQTEGQAHHAVIVFPAGTDYKKSGVVLDPWDRQSTDPEHMVWPYPAWAKRFSGQLKNGEMLR